MRGVTVFSLLVVMTMLLTKFVQGTKNRKLLPKDAIKAKRTESTLEANPTGSKRTPSPSGGNIFDRSAIPTFFTAKDSFPSTSPSHYEVSFQDCQGKGGKGGSLKGGKGESKLSRSGKGAKSKLPRSGKGAKSKLPRCGKGAKSKLPKSRKGAKSKFSRSGNGAKSKSLESSKSAKKHECQDEEEELPTHEPTLTEFPTETLGPELVVVEFSSNVQASSAAPALAMGFALVLALLLPVAMMTFHGL